MNSNATKNSRENTRDHEIIANRVETRRTLTRSVAQVFLGEAKEEVLIV